MNQNTRTRMVILAVLLTVVLGGCGKKKQPPPPPAPPPQPKPVTATLSASPTSIQRGQTATITWSTENADNVTLQGSKVDPSGSQTVSPTQSTDYHLVATGAGGTQDATARVTVAEPPPPPAPVTAPPPSDDDIFNQSVQDIYFDYDKAELRPESQQALTRAAQVINQHPNWQIRIEGNCDERGSTEYNLTLGESRADAAKQFLGQAGVGGDRLKTISYGKEKPVCTESTEDCWQKNRHDHFVLVH